VKVDEAAQPGITLVENFDDYLRLLWPATTAQLSDKVFARMQEAGRGADPDGAHGRLRSCIEFTKLLADVAGGFEAPAGFS
jgi:hypothetical protein